MKHKIYLAGPFFNPAQIALLEEIEALLDAAGIEYFSPRKSPESQDARDKGFNRERMADIFDANTVELQDCTLVLAVMDWKMPTGETVARVFSVEGQRELQCQALTIPDSGTVWEMGFALAVGKPVIGYYDSPNGKVNLMLSEGCFAICRGWHALQNFIDALECQTGREAE